MPLEAGDGFISGLVATNPVNATDQVAQGDDHIRLVKTAVKGTFPNLNGAVNATPAQLNVLQTDGAGAGMLADIAAIVAPGGDRILGWDFSALAAIAYTLGTGLTTVGTSLLIDTAVVPQLNVNPTFTVNTFTISNAAASNAQIHISGQAGVQRQLTLQTAGALRWALRCDATAEGGANAGSDFNITRYNDAGVFLGNAIVVFRDGSKITLAATTLDFQGVVSTPGTSAAEVGYNGTPLNTQDANYTLVLGDRGKTIYKSAGGAGETITIPANGAVAFPIGTQIDIVNNGGGTLTIAITTDTLKWVVGGATGSRTLADAGWAVIKKVTSTLWFVSGAGLT